MSGLIRTISTSALLLLLLGTGVTSADSVFINPRFDVGESPVALAVGDFNNDGWPDLVVANSDSDDLSVLLGGGDGSFDAELRFEAGDRPSDVAVADLDGDGRLDLAVALAHSDDVLVLFGVGDGTFTAPGRFGVGDYPGSIAVGDFNGDGHPDLVTANQASNDLSVLLGNGDGSFASESRLTIGEDPVTVVVEDFDGDGHQDLAAVSSLISSLFVFLGNGDGSFDAQTPLVIAAMAFAMAAGDLDGDGILDLAVSDFLSDQVAILLGVGDGSFDVEAPVRVLLPEAIAIGELDGDGIPDLVVAANDVDGFVARPGNGDGSFGPETRIVTGARRDLVLADVNADGHLDLASANGLYDDVAVVLGRGDGSFVSEPHIPVGEAPIVIVAEDFNGDGRADLATLNTNSSDVSVLLGDGEGDFAPERRFDAGRRPLAMVAGDFNGDGWPDLATGNRDSEDVVVLPGNGDGSFAPGVRTPTEEPPTDIAVGDFDEDGRLDLAMVRRLEDDVLILLGSGDGSFAAGDSLATGHCPLALAVADFNHDGHQDLATANTHCDSGTPSGFEASVSILLGNGDGSFAGDMPLSVTVSPRRLIPGDFDADGNQDLAVAYWGGDEPSSGFRILTGNGDGNFVTASDYPFRSVSVMIAEDFNGDGHPDLAATHSDLSAWLGNGDGTFALESFYWVGSFSSPVVSGDFNADGWPDLAVASHSLDAVRLLLNGGDHEPANIPPTADAGADAAAECTSPAGASILLDGSDSSDPDSTPGTNDDIVLFEWFEDYGTPDAFLLGTGESLLVTLPLGTHFVTLRVADSLGETATDTMHLAVVDTTPPEISVEVSPALLWPPNHKLVEVAATVVAEDACGEPEIALASVASNEPAGKRGSDIQGAEIGTADFSVLLRAERSGWGDGRTYTLVYTATDRSGNVREASATARVPTSAGLSCPAWITKTPAGEVSMAIRVVRLGSPRSQGEGLRVGTVRRPPRGVPKAEYASRDIYDVWLPELAPSEALLKEALQISDEREWRRFTKRYRAEMKRPEAVRLLALLAALSHQTDFSVGCYCADEGRCHRSVMRELLLNHGAKLA